MDLAGRQVERGALTEMVANARAGRGGALVLRGEPGSGKTALVADTIAGADGLTVVHVEGVESEVRIGFAALHRILLPFLDRLDQLPGPQQEALSAAFGRSTLSKPPPPMHVGLATLTLLTTVAEIRPVLCVVDDAHWVDRESVDVITFVARRLLADPVAILLTARSGERYDSSVSGLPWLEVAPLNSGACRALLVDRSSVEVSWTVASTLAGSTNGNPLALVELAQLLEPDQLCGLTPLPQPLPVGRSVGWKYISETRSLPDATRTVLLVAACEPSGRLDLIDSAAARLGTSLGAIEPAEVAGLVAVGDRIEFRHPLTRAAVYGAATAVGRSRAHRALAAQLLSNDAGEDENEERVRHLAAAATAPDDELADELQRCADRAGRLGRLRDSTDLLVLSARFTVDRDARGLRLLDAARASTVVGSFRRGTVLVDEAIELLGDPTALAAARWVQGLFSHDRSKGQAPARLLRATNELSELLPHLARGALVDAVTAFTLAGEFGDVTVEEISATARHLPVGTAGNKIEDILLESQVTWIESGFVAAVPILRGIAPAWCVIEMDAHDIARFGVLALLGTRELLDADAIQAMIDHSLPAARAAGAYGSMAILLLVASSEAIQAGRFGLTDSLLAEAHDVNAVLGTRLTPSMLDIEILAWRGRDDDVLAAAAELRTESEDTRHGFLARTVDAACVALALGRGRPADAIAPALRLAEYPSVGWTSRALPDLVEAAIRTGDRETAMAALDRLASRGAALDTPLALGLSARCRALVSDDANAEAHYLDSISHLSSTTALLDQARSELVYGEWLRRVRRPSDARLPLRSALTTFERIGAAAFAARSRDELAATGERARRRTVEASLELTPRESQVARLAADGLTNPEIAAALFISAATVEYHLSKVYRKLQLTSRRQLRQALPQ